MAFMCWECRESILEKDGYAIGWSFGLCEFCERISKCDDLKGGYLCKPDWKDIIQQRWQV